MGYLGKVLLGTAIGVGAVAAAPFTGGGSVLGGASLIASLSGAGLIAGVAGTAGAIGGAAVQVAEDNHKSKQMDHAKESAFSDGINEGKALTVEEIKKYADFYFATTALSYWIARCDGFIDDTEMLEIENDLDVIKKNKALPDAIIVEMNKIAENESISFEDVKLYLDKIDIETLKGLVNDIDEIIEANGEISLEEMEAKLMFTEYVEEREKLGDCHV